MDLAYTDEGDQEEEHDSDSLITREKLSAAMMNR